VEDFGGTARTAPRLPQLSGVASGEAVAADAGALVQGWWLEGKERSAAANAKRMFWGLVNKWEDGIMEELRHVAASR